MKLGAIVIVAATLVVTVVDRSLYGLPGQVGLLFYRSVPTAQADDKVYLMVRNCGRYTRQTGNLWWKRTEVDYRACSEDAGTRGDLIVIGELKQTSSPPPLRLLFTLACVSCKERQLLSTVTIPPATSPDGTTPPLKLPPNLRLDQEDMLQLLYTPTTDAQNASTIEIPHLE